MYDHMEYDKFFMQVAFEEAEKAYESDEVPIGAVIVRDEKIISRAHNLTEMKQDPTAHAEMLAIREAVREIRNWRLSGCTLYVTKEPCPMCAGAIVNSRITRVVYGCRDEKGGAVNSLYKLLSDRRLNHRAEVFSGVMAEECAALLRRFFKEKREGERWPSG